MKEHPTRYLTSIYLIIGLAVSLLLGGCTLTQPVAQSQVQVVPPAPYIEPSLSRYYQWLKGLEQEQLASEIRLQQARQAQGQLVADLYLLLLHSLPKSAIHNPYTAKAMLNQGHFNQYIYSHVSASDLAFITMLRDQLNQQLLLRQVNQDAKQQSEQKIAELTLKLAMFQQENNSLNQKLEQLKAIEAQLNTREH